MPCCSPPARSRTKPLNLPRRRPEGMYGAVSSSNRYDGYPTGAREWPLTARELAVIGGGNVAMDVLRELMRNADDLEGQDRHSGQRVRGHRPEQGQGAPPVHPPWRGPGQVQRCRNCARWRSCPACSSSSTRTDFDLDDETIEVAGKDKLTRQMVEELFAVREMAEDMEDDGDVDFEGNPAGPQVLRALQLRPTEILGEDGKVKAIRVERTGNRCRRQDAPHRRVHRLPG